MTPTEESRSEVSRGGEKTLQGRLKGQIGKVRGKRRSPSRKGIGVRKNMSVRKARLRTQPKTRKKLRIQPAFRGKKGCR